jgi:hypothetical protein
MLALASILATGPCAASAATVTCQDGTTAKSGRGACSHHGGVATSAETKTPQTKTSQGSVSCKDGSTSRPGRGACSHHGGVAENTPATVPQSPGAPKSAIPPGSPSASRGAGGSANATAQCRDGTYSEAAHHQGACSHHGGVARWLDQP